MLRTTVGQLLVNDALPVDMRDYNRVLTRKTSDELFRELAEKHPEQYREVAKKLSDVGRDVSYTTGGYSFGIKALKQSLAGRQASAEITEKVDQILNSNLSTAKKNEKILKLVSKYQEHLADDVVAEATALNNPLAAQIRGAGRGNKFQLNRLIGADLLYSDHHGNIIPVPVVHSYSQGLRPHEYFAGAFGARKGIVDIKTSTAKAGFLGKQLAQAAHRLVVSGLDDDAPYDESNPRGLLVSIDDPDNVGASLAIPVGGYTRNTELTPKILRELAASGHKRILIRSPIVGGPDDGGVWAQDVGRRERGDIPQIGDFVGIAAAQSITEPLAQGTLSSKHSGGVAGAAGAHAVSGFDFINNLVQVPKHFPGGAAHSQVDGRVEKIEAAPQGGNYVYIGGTKHYVGTDFPLKVHVGDTVEAGDVLSEGVPSPAEIVRYKGIGEGRRYFIQAFRDALDAANVRANRRNIELLARGLINHVRLEEEIGDYIPNDVVPYQALERVWKPRPGHAVVTPKAAVGKYLESPVLHYTIGTKVQPSMLKNLADVGVKKLTVHQEPPPFSAEMIRGMTNVAHDPDWMTRLLGSYQQRSLLQGVQRGAVSETESTSYVPALVSGAPFWSKQPGKRPRPLIESKKPGNNSAKPSSVLGD